MNPYMNEDIMWQRLKDIQLEAENRRLYGPRNLPALVALRSTWQACSVAGRARHPPGSAAPAPPGRRAGLRRRV